MTEPTLTKFTFKTVETTTRDIRCDACKAEGFNTNIVIIPNKVVDGKLIEVWVFCKACGKNAELIAYADYLAAVNLKPIGE